MTRIAVILGSTRPSRRGETVARWVGEVASRLPAVRAGDATVEVLDLAEYGLPLLDEPVPALFGQYRNAHTKRWAATIGAYDGFVFVTPEYNHAVPAALKNAIDFLYAEWNNKAAGFVSYGADSGIRAVEQLRLTMAEVQIADVRTQVALSPFTDFDLTGFDVDDPTSTGVCAPGEHKESTLTTMLTEIIAWSRALQPLRDTSAHADAQTTPA